MLHCNIIVTFYLVYKVFIYFKIYHIMNIKFIKLFIDAFINYFHSCSSLRALVFSFQANYISIMILYIFISQADSA